MKINFDQKVLDLDGEEMPDETGREKLTDEQRKDTPAPCLTLKSVVLGALCAALQDDPNSAPEKAFQRYELARLINKGGEQELTPEQASEIRGRLHKRWVLEVAGCAYEMLK